MDTSSAPASTPLGVPSTLPAEIRIMLYRNLVTSRMPNILQTSQAVNAETSHYFHRHGVYCLEFNGCKLPAIYPKQASVEKILNFDLRVNLTTLFSGWKSEYRYKGAVQGLNNWLALVSGIKYDEYNQTITQVTDTQIPRKYSRILLDCNPDFEGVLPSRTFDVLRTLTGFEVPDLEINNDYPPDSDHEMRTQCYRQEPSLRRQMYISTHTGGDQDIAAAYAEAMIALERKLGPSELIQVGEITRLRFQPRKNAMIASKIAGV